VAGDVMNLPTFQEMRRNAFRGLGDVEDELRSDWRSGTGPTTAQAKIHIAKAKNALDRAAQ
jgi:hypothetical protein